MKFITAKTKRFWWFHRLFRTKTYKATKRVEDFFNKLHEDAVRDFSRAILITNEEIAELIQNGEQQVLH